jgi:hypothetical protein
MAYTHPEQKQAVSVYRLFIDGDFVPAHSGQTIEVFDPARGLPMTPAAATGSEDERHPPGNGF